MIRDMVDDVSNYTPLNSATLPSKKKKAFFLSNRTLIGVILFLIIGVGMVSYLLVLQKPIRKGVPAQIEVTPTVTPIPSPTGEVTETVTPTPSEAEPTATPSAELTTTPEPTLTPTDTQTPTLTPEPTETAASNPTATPIPVACGTKSCDNTTNPCRSGLSCVQANDGSNYCTLPEFQDGCKVNPSQSSCCTAQSTSLTPTEIVLVNATATPGT